MKKISKHIVLSITKGVSQSICANCIQCKNSLDAGHREALRPSTWPELIIANNSL